MQLLAAASPPVAVSPVPPPPSCMVRGRARTCRNCWLVADCDTAASSASGSGTPAATFALGSAAPLQGSGGGSVLGATQPTQSEGDIPADPVVGAAPSSFSEHDAKMRYDMHGSAMPAAVMNSAVSTTQGPVVPDVAAVPGCTFVSLSSSSDEDVQGSRWFLVDHGHVPQHRVNKRSGFANPEKQSGQQFNPWAPVLPATSTIQQQRQTKMPEVSQQTEQLPQRVDVPVAKAVAEQWSATHRSMDANVTEDGGEPAKSYALKWSADSTTQGQRVHAAAAVPGCFLLIWEESDNEVPFKTPPSPAPPRPIFEDQALPVQALPVQATSGVMEDVECKVCDIWMPAHYLEDHYKSKRHIFLSDATNALALKNWIRNGGKDSISALKASSDGVNGWANMNRNTKKQV